MKRTGPEYGLEVSSTVDQRYHVELATRAACGYLKEAHEKLGSWVLAAASYNMGMSGVTKSLAAQHVDNYWDLHLNSETARYVYRLLACGSHGKPDQFGFQLTAKDVYAPLEGREVRVSQDVEDLASFAIEQGTNLRELKAFNPWLRRDHLDVGEGQVYVLRIPA